MAHKARKRFGQNFLHDHNIINNILSQLQIAEQQHWVEIGPGKGALTRLLVKENINLDIIELDRDLVTYLENEFSRFNNLIIHSADALKFDFSALAAKQEKLSVIGNLPYNISTPLLFHLFSHAEHIENMYFMLQKEVVNRICAIPGNKKYGRLSVMMQYYCDSEFLFEVRPESFEPAPKVMSAVVKLTPHRTPPVALIDKNNFNQVVIQAFSQRRKTLRNSLKKLISAEQFIDVNIDSSLRAESLSLEQFAQLSNLIKPRSQN